MPTPGSETPPPLAPDALQLIQGLTALHESVAIIDARGRVLWVSQGLSNLLGVREVAGRHWREMVPADEITDHLAERMELAGRVVDAPIRLRGRDGIQQARLSAARVGCADEHGPTVAILRIEPDSSEVRSEFRHTVEYLSAVLESAPDGVVVVDESRFITYANPAAREITGYACEELVDRPLALLVRSAQDVERIAQVLDPQRPLSGQLVEIRRRDGETRCVEMSASVLRLHDGRPAGAVAYVRDVTEQHRAEQNLERKNAELEHYVDAVSHDLRTPLMSLLGFSRLLREDYGEALDDKGRHFLRRIEEAGRSMEDLIGDLLELSRIGRTAPSDDWVDPRPVLQQLQAELKPRLDDAGIDLTLPEDPPLLRCERTRLYQIFANLIGNAIDHMGNRSEPRIEIQIDGDEGQNHLRVIDNGRGIDPKHHDRVFEIFQSLGPRRDGQHGTGIGLAIVKKIAETRGGRAWVESEPGAGSTFHLTLLR